MHSHVTWSAPGGLGGCGSLYGLSGQQLPTPQVALSSTETSPICAKMLIPGPFPELQHGVGWEACQSTSSAPACVTLLWGLSHQGVETPSIH